MNEDSSRSHMLFTIVVNGSDKTSGKLSLVDLAGSENTKKSHATGDVFKEANNINLSLMRLFMVIRELAEKNKTNL